MILNQECFVLCNVVDGCNAANGANDTSRSRMFLSLAATLSGLGCVSGVSGVNGASGLSMMRVLGASVASMFAFGVVLGMPVRCNIKSFFEVLFIDTGR